MDLQFPISNEYHDQTPKSFASQSISLGTLIFYESNVFEIIPKQGHFKSQDIKDFLDVRNSFFEAPFKMLYNATAKHSYSYAALKILTTEAKSNLIAVYSPLETRHAGFDSLLAFSPESAYHYFTNHQDALAWLKSFD